MRRNVALAVALAIAALAAAAPPARAGENDLVLGRLALLVGDPGVSPNRAVGQNLEFRSLVSELGVALAPRLSTPADTLGFGGFQFAADTSWTSISADAGYWRARQGSPDPTGAGGMAHGEGQLQNLGLFMRKGMWFPVPSLEFGAGAVHLMGSRLWTAQGYAKVALHEGYHDMPIPSLAVRGAVSRLIGQKDLDLTIISIDASIGKHVGVGGTWNANPYLGYNVLLMVPRSEVIDPTPNVDGLDPANMDDRQLNFVFKDQDDIIRHRVFFGAKLRYYVFALTVEGTYAMAGSSIDDRASADECTLASRTTNCDSPDQAKAQTTLTVAAGLDF
ncbi:MAG: hypothetical protein KBG48_21385 [Kofleriaceae bacterium]|nr:hypothetical protein [Kofleriaceae bacterium]MBP9169972.1 hypothetical protein [Kofleriaceae bacterium]MBP9862935.1 hypothetical protein [Kofleriaceae bacterium]